MENKTSFLVKTGRTIIPKPTIIFTEEIDPNEAVVFVANHEKNYGPSIMQLFFPYSYRPWVIYRMLEDNICCEYIREEFFEERWKLPSPISGWIARLIEPVLIKLMNSTRPIPVYRGVPSCIAQTFRDSLDTLEAGENLLIFPEHPNKGPYSAHVKDIYRGFLFLTKLYKRKTGKNLSFVPVSVNPKQRQISVGKKVRFNPEADYEQEKERIARHLMQQIDHLYETPWNRDRKEEHLVLSPGH